MDIKQLVAGLKEKGVSDEEIAQQLTEIKNQIDEILGAGANEEQPDNEDDKMSKVFGI